MKREHRVLSLFCLMASSFLFLPEEGSWGQDLLTVGYYLSKGNYPAAIRYLSSSEEAQEPDNALVEYLLGLSYWNAGEISRATQHLRKASEMRPESPEILLMLAVALEEKGNLAEAYSVYREVLDLTSNASVLALAGSERTQHAGQQPIPVPSNSSQVTLQGGPEGIEMLVPGEHQGLLLELRTEGNRGKCLPGVPLQLVLRVLNQGIAPVNLFKYPPLKWFYWREEDPAATKMGGASRPPKLGPRDRTFQLPPGQQCFFPLSPITGLRPGVWQFESSMQVPLSSESNPLPFWVKAPPLTIEVPPLQ